MNIKSWQLAFAQNCNMRCTYCHTCHGALGRKPSVMKPSVWKKLGQQIVNGIPPGNHANIAFGCGETFMYFEAFASFVTYLESLAFDRNVGLHFHVSTNGIALNREKMKWLAEHRINLSFSIDGPESIHDRCRRDIDGKPTHQRIMHNWKFYRELSLSLPQSPSCNVQSVIHDHSRLKEVAQYWVEQDVPIFDTVVQEPLPAYLNRSSDGWQLRRENYISDLRELAFESARRHHIPTFFTDYSGPSIIILHWKDLFLERTAGACSAGTKVVSVDANGNIYPCDGFLAYPEWHIGSISKGIDSDRVYNFTRKREALLSECDLCEANILCAKGCCAASPDVGLVLNSQGGCDFMREIVKISRGSYEMLQS